jgi:hypothetical protein
VTIRAVILGLVAGLAGASCASRPAPDGAPAGEAPITSGLLAKLRPAPRIELREGMNRVQRQYVILFDEIERGSNFGARDAARGLEAALAAPEVSRSPPAADASFRELLAAAMSTTAQVEAQAERFDQEKLTRLRGDVSRSCRTCHARFRATD